MSGALDACFTLWSLNPIRGAKKLGASNARMLKNTLNRNKIWLREAWRRFRKSVGIIWGYWRDAFSMSWIRDGIVTNCLRRSIKF